MSFIGVVSSVFIWLQMTKHTQCTVHCVLTQSIYSIQKISRSQFDTLRRPRQLHLSSHYNSRFELNLSGFYLFIYFVLVIQYYQHENHRLKIELGGPLIRPEQAISTTLPLPHAQYEIQALYRFLVKRSISPYNFKGVVVAK